MTLAASSERTRNYLRQVKGAAVYRAAAMAASFVAVRFMIEYLGHERFGVWSTLLTIMSWVVFFDLGIGNGLRNKVAEALAKAEIAEARDYISSAYTLIAALALMLWAGFAAASYLVSWQAVFNTRAVAEPALRESVQISSFFVVLNFWLGLIASLLGAVQRTAAVAAGQVLCNVFVLAFVYLLARGTDASISVLALGYGGSLAVANCALSLWFYRQRPGLRPRFRVDWRHLRPLLATGLQFFVIQLAVLVIFSTDKLLITQLFGPKYVTQYDVVFRLFSMLTILHTIVSAPLWSAYTEAYHRSDIPWIRRMLGKQLKVCAAIAVLALLGVFVARPVIRLWIGSELAVAPALVAMMAVFVVVSAWNNVFAMFVNGIGQVRLQLYTAVAAMFLNIPLSIFFAKHTSLGISSVVLGTVCSLMLAAVALPLQVNQLLRPNLRPQTI